LKIADIVIDYAMTTGWYLLAKLRAFISTAPCGRGCALIPSARNHLLSRDQRERLLGTNANFRN
jgi:hypothetical protein